MAVKRDLYEVLGVSRDAGADDIRKAYRRLARQHHPDANGGDTEAGERFKEISQAYEVLSNPDKRSRYDRFGTDGANGDADAGFGGFGPFTDIFDVFFGAGGRAADQGPQRGADLRFDLEVTLEEVLNGADKTIPVSRLETCGECSGSGARTGTKPQTCVACGGAGHVQTQRSTIFGRMSQISECYRCHGRGEVITDPCSRCGGRGRERQTRRIQVDIPPGAEERTRIRLNGQGEAGPTKGLPGDLYVFIHVKPHPLFRRQGRDLVSEIEISFARASLGGSAEIPTLTGNETLNIPEGTQPGDVFRLRGRGLPELSRPQVRGDQHVVIRVRTPTGLNERQRRALQEFAEAGGEDLSRSEEQPNERGFFEWIRNLFTGKESQGDD